jgi:hypothetical protein
LNNFVGYDVRVCPGYCTGFQLAWHTFFNQMAETQRHLGNFGSGYGGGDVILVVGREYCPSVRNEIGEGRSCESIQRRVSSLRPGWPGLQPCERTASKIFRNSTNLRSSPKSFLH